ncbi:MAG: hypothetical protein AAF749_11190 [Pseudomonadota bacterium]
MIVLRCALFFSLSLSAVFVNADTALDEYNATLSEAEHSAQAQLLLGLLLKDCDSFLDVEGWKGFEELVDRARKRLSEDFDTWEANARRRFGACHGLIDSFASADEYLEMQLSWVERSIESGSALAQLIRHHEREREYSSQQSLRAAGVVQSSIETEKPPVYDFLHHVRESLFEAYEYGHPRLQWEALFYVHVKFRKAEDEVLGTSESHAITPQQEHEMLALRTAADEMPWEYLSCKYQKDCDASIFFEYVGEIYSDEEIGQFIDTASYYERCIEAGDWVSLDLQG